MSTPTTPATDSAPPPPVAKPRSKFSLWGLLEAASVLAILAALLGWGGRWAWWLDMASHFRVQYAVSLALAATLFAVKRRWRWTAAAGAMALLNALTLQPFMPTVSVAELPPGHTRYRALLLNVNTNYGDPQQVAEYLTRLAPDFIILEEISDDWLRQLAEPLAAYPCQRVVPNTDNFGIGLFSKHPCESTRVAFYGEAAVPSVIAEFRLAGRPLTLVGTHPVPPMNAEYAALRNEHLRLLAAELATMPHPVLLLGDLNVTPWSSHFRDFVTTSGLRHAARGRGLHLSWPSFQPWLLIPLDHALHSPTLPLLDSRIGEGAGSDHYPVVVEFAWPSE